MNESTRKVMHSSKKTDYGTPIPFFKKYDDIYHFDLDACALPFNTKCKNFFSPEEDGLIQEWNGMIWLNPPYNKPEMPCKKKCTKKKCVERGFHTNEYVPGKIDWVRKAYQESRKSGCVVVSLLPVRTDTNEFHDYIYHGKAMIEFIKGRIWFIGADGPAPFPSMVVAWGL